MRALAERLSCGAEVIRHVVHPDPAQAEQLRQALSAGLKGLADGSVDGRHVALFENRARGLWAGFEVADGSHTMRVSGANAPDIQRQARLAERLAHAVALSEGNLPLTEADFRHPFGGPGNKDRETVDTMRDIHENLTEHPGALGEDGRRLYNEIAERVNGHRPGYLMPQNHPIPRFDTE